MENYLERPELIAAIEEAARSKNIDKADIFLGMEKGIAKIAKAKYGYDRDIVARINQKSGVIRLFGRQEVVETIENPEMENMQIVLANAQKINPELKVGEFIETELPLVEFGRGFAQTVRQVITQSIKDSERTRQYTEFKDREGEIISGTVKHAEYGNVIVDIGGRAEGFLGKDELIPRESLHTGDRVRALIMQVRDDSRGPQIILSRTHPNFMSKLFMQEVPEIYEGVIEIKAVARDPGSKAKLAVHSKDSSLDPVGACVGMRGTRVQSIVNELQGEKVDIVLWSADIGTFVVNALTPAKASKVVIDEKAGKIEVVVPEDQFSLAIGRRGQNVRLASQIVGKSIDILTEAQESERRQEEFKIKSALFIQALDIDEMIAQLLVSEGFMEIDEVAYVPMRELTSIQGFTEELATELQNRAKAYLEKTKNEIDSNLKKLNVAKDLLDFAELTPNQTLILAQKNVKTLMDVADLASDELQEMLPELNLETAGKIIMAARDICYKD
jgi:N utilization substance protein A